MMGSRNPSRNSSYTSYQSKTGPQHDAAVLGAAVAFLKPTLARNFTLDAAAAGNAPSSAGGHGAQTAASAAGRGSTTRSSSQVSMRPPPSRAGSNMGNLDKSSASGGVTAQSEWKNLAPSSTQERARYSRSPSQQAAAAAALRAPLSTSPSMERMPQVRSVGVTRPIAADKSTDRPQTSTKQGSGRSDEASETTSLPSTTALVDLFEGRLHASSQNTHSRPVPIVVKPSKDLSLQSPKPVKPGEGITSMFQLEIGRLDTANTAADARSMPISQSPEDYRIVVPRGSIASLDRSPTSADKPRSSLDGARSPIVSTDQLLSSSYRSQLTSAPSSPRSSFQLDRRRPSSVNTLYRPNTIPTPGQTVRTLPAQYNQLHPRRPTPLTNDNELANAMVASSLASSRATSKSPLKLDIPPAVPARRKKQAHHAHLSRHGVSFSRTPSPAKTGMLHTLRHHDSDDSDTSSSSSRRHGGATGHGHGGRRQHAKRLVRKHPNKHHEGDRKRWRDAVSERARKRYEGVWAANKGRHCSFTPAEQNYMTRQAATKTSASPTAAITDDDPPGGNLAEQVSNLAAREIWQRSRLPVGVLEAVWDLVDTDATGRLRKDEFVVGMWLIDQRLKGRKLPVKVSETVWASVRRLHGIKVKIKK